MGRKVIRISTVPVSLKNLLKGQLKMLSRYYEVIAISSPGQDLDDVSLREGVRVIPVPIERRISLVKDFISLFKLIAVFRKERPWMVHSLTPKAGLLSMLAAKITRVPVRMHTFTGLVFPTAGGMLKPLLILMDRITCYCATHINPEGEGVKRDLLSYKITRKPLHVIAQGNINGIDMDYYSRTDEVIRKAGMLKEENTFTFCFIGRIVGDKGINELVGSFDRLYKENNRIRLFLVGPFEDHLDPVLPEIKEMISHHAGIVFTGWKEDVRPYLAASDAFVFPSYREGFPNVVMQAGAMGLPSIVTDINGSNEIIIDGKNGVIIPSKNANALYEAMKSFAESPDELLRMSLNSREMIAGRYDRDIVWKAILEEYRKIENHVS